MPFRAGSSWKKKLTLGALVLVCSIAAINLRWLGYVGHLAKHQLKVVFYKEKISERLKQPGLAPAEKQALEATLKIRSFAETAYGIKNSKSYTYYYALGRPELGFNITAAPALSLKPESFHFWPIGSFDYLGFFDRDYALDWAQKYRDRGFDVHVSLIGGYSTLGWFEDPLYSSQVAGGEYELASLIAHEIAHERLYFSGDTTFSELLASFVGEKLAADYFAAAGKKITESAAAREQRYSELSDLILLLRQDLEKLYASPLGDAEKLAQKAKRIAEFSERLRERRAYFRLKRIPEINNALLAQYHRYTPRSEAFEKLFKECKIAENQSVYVCWFKKLEELKPCTPSQRKNWLGTDGRISPESCRRA